MLDAVLSCDCSQLERCVDLCRPTAIVTGCAWRLLVSRRSSWTYPVSRRVPD